MSYFDKEVNKSSQPPCREVTLLVLHGTIPMWYQVRLNCVKSATGPLFVCSTMVVSVLVCDGRDSILLWFCPRLLVTCEWLVARGKARALHLRAPLCCSTAECRCLSVPDLFGRPFSTLESLHHLYMFALNARHLCTYACR